MKNNLYSIRTYIEVMPSVISNLLNIRADAYLSYENGINEIPEVILDFLSLMYKIPKDAILSNDTEAYRDYIRFIEPIKMAKKEEKNKLLIENITGERRERLGYREINLIKEKLKRKNK